MSSVKIELSCMHALPSCFVTEVAIMSRLPWPLPSLICAARPMTACICSCGDNKPGCCHEVKLDGSLLTTFISCCCLARGHQSAHDISTLEMVHIVHGLSRYSDRMLVCWDDMPGTSLLQDPAVLLCML